MSMELRMFTAAPHPVTILPAKVSLWLPVTGIHSFTNADHAKLPFLPDENLVRLAVSNALNKVITGNGNSRPWNDAVNAQIHARSCPSHGPFRLTVSRTTGMTQPNSKAVPEKKQKVSHLLVFPFTVSSSCYTVTCASYRCVLQERFTSDPDVAFFKRTLALILAEKLGTEYDAESICHLTDVVADGIAKGMDSFDRATLEAWMRTAEKDD